MDQQRWISSFSQLITDSIAYMYIFALCWAPEDSWINKSLAPSFKHHPLVTSGKERNWGQRFGQAVLEAEPFSLTVRLMDSS